MANKQAYLRKQRAAAKLRWLPGGDLREGHSEKMKVAWVRSRKKYVRGIRKSRRTSESRLRTAQTTKALWRRKSYRRKQDAANPIRRKAVFQTNRNFHKTSKIQISVFKSLCARGFKGVRLEYAEFPYSVDIAFPNTKVAIEIDGRFWHSLCRKKDRVRDRFLKQKGWRVIRLSADQKLSDIMAVLLEAL